MWNLCFLYLNIYIFQPALIALIELLTVICCHISELQCKIFTSFSFVNSVIWWAVDGFLISIPRLKGNYKNSKMRWPYMYNFFSFECFSHLLKECWTEWNSVKTKHQSCKEVENMKSIFTNHLWVKIFNGLS